MTLARYRLVLPFLACALGPPAFALDCNLNGIADDLDLGEVLCRPFVENERLSEQTAAGITVADLDGDGDDDAVLAGRTVDVVLNRGDGTFALPVAHVVPGLQPPAHADLADMDGDGFADIVVVASATELGTLPGDGRGGFGEPRFVTWGGANFAETLNAFGDVDGDDDADLVNYGAAILLVHNRGGGTLEVEALWSLEAPERASSAVLLDLEGDGDLDLVVALSTGRLLVFRNTPGGTFAAPESISTSPSPFSIEAADLDGDMDDDLLVSHPADSRFAVFENVAGALVPGPAIASPQAFTFSPRLADLDGDGDVDIVVPGVPVEGVASRGFVILDNHGAMEFEPVPCSVVLEPRLGVLTPIEVEPFHPDASRSGEMNLLVWNYERFGRFGGAFVFRRRAETRSEDCNQNGVPDECEAELRGCRDCNDNGVPDAEDIALGRSADENGNGIPDSCEGPGARFAFRFDAPRALQASAGVTLRFFADVEIHSQGYAAGEPGLQAWSLLVTADEAEIIDVTLAGTVAAPVPEGLRRNGFELTGFVPPPNPIAPLCPAQAASIVVLSFQEPITLDIAASPSRVLRLALETTAPAEGVKTVTLGFYLDTCLGPPIRAPGTAFADDGGGATGGFIHPVVVYQGANDNDVAFYPTDVLVYERDPVFHRGDANDDGRLDISDVIRIANKLFLGGVALGCRDAADANDDGRLDVSDVISVSSFLYLGGAAPRRPGPPGTGAVCGLDRPGELNGDLGCVLYASCP